MFKVFILTLSVLPLLTADNNMDLVNYYNYHDKVIEAEELIFIEKDSIAGLKKFEEVFQMYDFVFVDDCIEAFQLACFYKNDKLALFFIKKALNNGFLIDMLFYLNCGSPHNFYNGMDKRVSIHKEFMTKYDAELRRYQDSVFNEYIKTINKPLLKGLIACHTKEQIYKNYHPELGYKSYTNQKGAYNKVCNENLAFIKKQYQNNTFIGAKNIGFLSNELLSQLKIIYLNTNNQLDFSILKKYNLPKNTDIPIQKEEDVFSNDMVYNILFHSKKAFQELTQYKDDAIRLGYLHPREYASLKFSSMRGRIPVEQDMHLEVYWKKVKDTTKINKMRKSFHLPSYEVDYEKFLFAQKHNLKLSFGFFNGTK